jgi:hypothetical protein
LGEQASSSDGATALSTLSLKKRLTFLVVHPFGEGGIAMANERINDLSAFKGCIGERLADGGSNLTLDEALVNWELENQTDAERGETLQAIRLGLDDM